MLVNVELALISELLVRIKDDDASLLLSDRLELRASLPLSMEGRLPVVVIVCGVLVVAEVFFRLVLFKTGGDMDKSGLGEEAFSSLSASNSKRFGVLATTMLVETSIGGPPSSEPFIFSKTDGVAPDTVRDELLVKRIVLVVVTASGVVEILIADVFVGSDVVSATDGSVVTTGEDIVTFMIAVVDNFSLMIPVVVTVSVVVDLITDEIFVTSGVRLGTGDSVVTTGDVLVAFRVVVWVLESLPGIVVTFKASGVVLVADEVFVICGERTGTDFVVTTGEDVSAIRVMVGVFELLLMDRPDVDSFSFPLLVVVPISGVVELITDEVLVTSGARSGTDSVVTAGEDVVAFWVVVLVLELLPNDRTDVDKFSFPLSVVVTVSGVVELASDGVLVTSSGRSGTDSVAMSEEESVAV